MSTWHLVAVLQAPSRAISAAGGRPMRSYRVLSLQNDYVNKEVQLTASKTVPSTRFGDW
jgi:hypothetical protein